MFEMFKNSVQVWAGYYRKGNTYAKINVCPYEQIQSHALKKYYEYLYRTTIAIELSSELPSTSRSNISYYEKWLYFMLTIVFILMN